MHACPPKRDRRTVDVFRRDGEVDQPRLSESTELKLAIANHLRRIRRNDFQIMRSAEGNQRVPCSSPRMHTAHNGPNTGASLEPIDAMVEIRHTKQQMIESIPHRHTSFAQTQVWLRFHTQRTAV